MDPICPLVHNHGGEDDTEDSGDATDQGSTSQSDEQPSSYDDDDEVGNDNVNKNPPDSPQCSSKEEVKEVTFLLLNIHHINMC